MLKTFAGNGFVKNGRWVILDFGMKVQKR